MKQNQQISLKYSRNSPRKLYSRLNYTQKQFEMIQPVKLKTFQLEIKKQSTPIKQLFGVDDQPDQSRKEKLDSNRKIFSRLSQQNINRKFPSPYSQTKHKKNIYIQQFNSRKDKHPHEQYQHLNYFDKKNSHPELRRSPKYNRFKQKPGTTSTQELSKQHKRKTFGRQKQSLKNEKKSNNSSNLSMTDKINRLFKMQQALNKRHEDLNLQQRLRSYSNIQSYSRFQSPNGSQELEVQCIGKSFNFLDNRKLKIMANKAQTVREMLGKLKMNEQKPYIEKQQPETNSILQFQLNRLPFDPYPKSKSRQNHKRFISFKLQQQKKIQHMRRKLEEHINKNSQIINNLTDVEIRFLQKPTFSPWVEKNRGITKRRRNNPLTCRPLDLLN